MNRGNWGALALLLTAALGAQAGAQDGAVARHTPAQRVAVPTYFRPGKLWTQLEAAAPTAGIAIINPGSGPGAAPDAGYQAQVKQAQGRGLTVLGYVHTSDGKRDIADVRREIGQYAQWYGVNGIMVDEVSSDCALLPYYTQINLAVKASRPGAMTVLNPGNETGECYLSAGDILITFESDYQAYVRHYSALPWTRKYPPSRFWHLVYGAPDAQAMRAAIRLSKERRAGWVYVTPDALPNPWDTLSGGTYWKGELAATAGH